MFTDPPPPSQPGFQVMSGGLLHPITVRLGRPEANFDTVVHRLLSVWGSGRGDHPLVGWADMVMDLHWSCSVPHSPHEWTLALSVFANLDLYVECTLQVARPGLLRLGPAPPLLVLSGGKYVLEPCGPPSTTRARFLLESHMAAEVRDFLAPRSVLLVRVTSPSARVLTKRDILRSLRLVVSGNLVLSAGCRRTLHSYAGGPAALTDLAPPNAISPLIAKFIHRRPFYTASGPPYKKRQLLSLTKHPMGPSWSATTRRLALMGLAALP